MVIAMSQISYAFLFSCMAGLSTLLGTIPIFFSFQEKERFLAATLSFAAGVMITVSLTDLLPESIVLLKNVFFPIPAYLFLFIFFVLGLLLSMFVVRHMQKKETKGVKNQKLYRIGLVSMIAIILHNLPEGIATFLSSSQNMALGLTLTIAIALHNIPEGISISIPVYYATNSRKKACLYTLFSGLSEPFGALVAYLFLAPFINDQIMGFLLSMIAGIMIHISIYELLKEAFSYQKRKTTILSFLFGFIVMLGSHFLLNS